MDMIPHISYVAQRRARFFWGTLWGYAAARWWGVRMGSGCAFHGRTRFRRIPGSHVSIGDACTFLSSVNANLIGVDRPCMVSTMTGDADIVIGSRCGFSGTVIASFDRIVVGDDVTFGANTLVTDSDWHPEDPRSGPAAPVTIGNRVWLGVGAVVLKGTSIGENTVIGARSVVASDVPPDVVAAGNPCRVIRQLETRCVPDHTSADEQLVGLAYSQ